MTKKLGKLSSSGAKCHLESNNQKIESFKLRNVSYYCVSFQIIKLKKYNKSIETEE